MPQLKPKEIMLFYENLQKIINTVFKSVMLLLMDDFSATILLEDLVKLRELQQG
jgi:hypothetical protein